MSDESDLPPDFPGADGVAAMVSAVRALLQPVLEGTVGYRAASKDAGFSDEAASLIAADFHHVVTKMITTNLGQK